MIVILAIVNILSEAALLAAAAPCKARKCRNYLTFPGDYLLLLVCSGFRTRESADNDLRLLEHNIMTYWPR